MVVWIGKKIRPKLPHRRATVKPGDGLLQDDPRLPCLIHIDAQDSFRKRLASFPGHPQSRTGSSPKSAYRAEAFRPAHPVHRCSMFSPSRLTCPVLYARYAQHSDAAFGFSKVQCPNLRNRVYNAVPAFRDRRSGDDHPGRSRRWLCSARFNCRGWTTG